MDNHNHENPDLEFENVQPKVENHSSKLCFICLKDTNSNDGDGDADVNLQDNCDRDCKRKARERDKKKCGVKIVTSYILQHSFPSSKENQDREKLQTSILTSFSEENLSICPQCLSKAEKLVELHLELEKIRMQILNVLKSLQDYLKSSLEGHDAEIQDNAVISRFQGILLQEFLYRQLSNELQVRLTPSAIVTVAKNGNSSFSNTSLHDIDPLQSCDIEFKEDEDLDADKDNDNMPEVDEDCEGVESGNEDYNFVNDEAYNFVNDEASSSSSDPDDDDESPNTNEDINQRAGQHPMPKILTNKQLQSLTILWECDICLENIPSTEMQSHLKTHPEFEKYYICDLCPSSSSRSQSSKRVYGTYKGLIWHYLRAYHIMQVPCILCPDQKQSTLFGREGLCRHLYEIHHPTHNKLQCTEESCSAEFYDPDSQRHHIIREHPNLNSNSRSGKQKVKCPHCSKLMSKKHLPEHIKNIHVLKGKREWRENRKMRPKGIDAIFECHICDQTFSTHYDRISHIHRFHPESLLSCASCPHQKFRTEMSLKVHQLAYHQEPEDSVKCLEHNCSETFGNKKLLRKHIRIVHEKKPLLQCQFCPKSFLWQRNLKSHVELHHKTYKCTEPNCSYSGASWRNLRSHQKKTHEAKKKIKKFKCSQCPFVTTTSQYLRLHESIHLEKTMPCKECGKLFSTKETLKIHERNHRKKSEPSDPMPCPTCGKIFNRPGLLQQHIQVVHEKKRKKIPDDRRKRKTYKCPEPGCSYEACSHSALFAHSWVHKEKTFLCQHCSKGFKKKVNLENHERSHVQEKSFICQVEGCEEAFVSLFLRTLHEKKVHNFPNVKGDVADGRKYVCDVCQKDYKELRELRRHQVNAHGQPEMVKCPRCPKMLKKDRLRRHVKKVHEKEFRCQHCPEIFTRKIQLKYHEKTHDEDSNNGTADKEK